MSHELIGSYGNLAWTVVKAVLLFLVAVVGLRLAERRVFAQLDVFDFVVTVAVGAIVGRTATASTASFATGAVALITLLVTHRIFTEVRRRGWLGGALDRRPRILIAQGQLQSRALRSAGLTRSDVFRLLRQAEAGDPTALQYVIYEAHGAITIVRDGQHQSQAIRVGLAEAGIDTSA